MKDTIRKYKEKLESGFWGFWVKKYKLSLMLVFFIAVAGIYSVIAIPKESMPNIDIGIIQISTSYNGIAPSDVDELITDKIESQIEDIDGIDTINSTSRLGFSSITVQLTNDADVKEVQDEIESEVDSVSLPSDADDPMVADMSDMDMMNMMFQVIVYGDRYEYNIESLIDTVVFLQDEIEQIPGISGVDISGSDEIEVQVLIDQNKLQDIGLTMMEVSSIIRSFNQNRPLGNHTVDDYNYDFRIQGELNSIANLAQIPLVSDNGSSVYLNDIATIRQVDKNERISLGGSNEDSGNNYVGFNVNKQSGASIFTTSSKVKSLLEETMSQPQFQGLDYQIMQDLSDYIRQDYDALIDNAIITLSLVFFLLWLFIGIKEGLIASLILPLAFCITFIVLNFSGVTLNFLTNFSLILTLGVAIDVIVVVVQSASEYLKLGYTPKSAVLLTIREYKGALISGTMTTVVAFLPLMFLPGIMGRFLFYIPLTVFATLLAALTISLTLNSAIFFKLNKDKDTYELIDKEAKEYYSDEQLELLEYERKGKKQKGEKQLSYRDRILEFTSDLYSKILTKFLSKGIYRWIGIISPVVLLVLSFVFISPRLGFVLFPEGDSTFMQVAVRGGQGQNKESIEPIAYELDEMLAEVPEIKAYSIDVNGDTINSSVELYTQDYRNARNLKHSDDVEEYLYDNLEYIESDGFNIKVSVQSQGPPTGTSISTDLVADSNENFDTLIAVSRDFENWLSGLEGTMNITNSIDETGDQGARGEFAFEFDREVLRSLGLTPNDVAGELRSVLDGQNAGVLKGQRDRDIMLYTKQFKDQLSPRDIIDLTINTKVGPLDLGTVLDYEYKDSINTITRKDGNIVITVGSEYQQGYQPNELQAEFNEFASSYDYPEGISFDRGGEMAENADIIEAMFVSLGVALFSIFALLVLQFNSYGQPFIIIYSVVMSLFGANVGMWLTGNPYSLPFGIGFVAVTGIIVNGAIILIDSINSNLAKGMDIKLALKQAGKTRLNPIMLTTLTTILGVGPLGFEDPFWAGIAFTIVFGLLVGSIATLFVVPALYYQFFRDTN